MDKERYALGSATSISTIAKGKRKQTAPKRSTNARAGRPPRVEDIDADMIVDLKNPGGGKHKQRGMRVKHRLLQADGAAEEVPHRHDGEFGNHDVERRPYCQAADRRSDAIDSIGDACGRVSHELWPYYNVSYSLRRE